MPIAKFDEVCGILDKHGRAPGKLIPMQLDIRRNIIRKLCKVLEQKHLKETSLAVCRT